MVKSVKERLLELDSDTSKLSYDMALLNEKVKETEDVLENYKNRVRVGDVVDGDVQIGVLNGFVPPALRVQLPKFLWQKA